MWGKQDTHFAGCTLCQSTAGPFVVCSIPSYNVQTPQGPIVIDTPLVLCAPNDGREGCAGELCRTIGYASPGEMVAVQTSIAAGTAKVEELEEQLAMAHADVDARDEALAERVAAKVLEKAGAGS